jgi:hypothetical protein
MHWEDRASSLGFLQRVTTSLCASENGLRWDERQPGKKDGG